MAAARVQMIVHHIRAGHVVGDHREAAAAIGIGLAIDVEPMRQRFCPRRLRVHRFGAGADINRLGQTGDLELKRNRRHGIGRHFDIALHRPEAGRANRHRVMTDRHGDK